MQLHVLRQLAPNGQTAAGPTEDDGTERRSALRIELPFPATVRGVDAAGERFKLDSVLDNLSTHGLYVRLPRRVEPGARLLVVVRLSLIPDLEVPAATVALRGVVLRSEPQPDGRWGLAVQFDRHRFLYTRTT